MKRRASLLLPLCALLAACEDDAVPRPKGWPRLDLPEARYEAWADSTLGLEKPPYATMIHRKAEAGARWYDLRFPGQRATVHLTYSRVNRDLPQLIEDAHGFKRKHEAKATRVRSEHVLRPEARVYGTRFDVEGDVASPCVFYLTDSTRNFLYGALYFDAPPNADSLSPVTERMRADIGHLAATLRWSAR